MAVVLGTTTDYLLGLSDEPVAPTPTVRTGDNSQVAIGNKAPVIYARSNVTITNSGNATVAIEKDRARRERILRKTKFTSQ